MVVVVVVMVLVVVVSAEVLALVAVVLAVVSTGKHGGWRKSKYEGEGNRSMGGK